MVTRFPLALAPLALALAACHSPERQPAADLSARPLSAAEARLPLASLSWDTASPEIYLLVAPLSELCRISGTAVELCNGGAPLRMPQARYDALRAELGPRKPETIHLRKILRTEDGAWHVVAHPFQQKPLVWVSPERPESIYLWPVEPGVDQIQSTGSLEEIPRTSPLGDRTLRIDFPSTPAGGLRKFGLRWSPDSTLEFKITRPGKTAHIRIEGSGPNLLTRSLARALKAGGAEVTEAAPGATPEARILSEADLVIGIAQDSTSPMPSCLYSRSDLHPLAAALCTQTIRQHEERTLAPFTPAIVVSWAAPAAQPDAATEARIENWSKGAAHAVLDALAHR